LVVEADVELVVGEALADEVLLVPVVVDADPPVNVNFWL